jgi:hypothetical protein
MLLLGNGRPGILCERRAFLRAGGGLAISGFALAQALAGRQVQARPRSTGGGAKSCILVYLLGGPPHLDMWDLKPAAPAEVRGPFRPIPTNVPGVQICEHLPRLAGRADRYALVRSVSHPNHNHTPMIYYTLTGRPVEQPNSDNDVRPPQRNDFPHVGAVLAKFKPGSAALPGYVALPEVAVRSSTSGPFKRARPLLRGGGAGFLGPRFDPLPVNGEPGSDAAIPALALPAGVSPDQFERRSDLLSLLDRSALQGRATHQHAELRQVAVSLTGSASRGGLRAFSLKDEPGPVRDRYGRNRFGASLILARRLVEAGVPMIAIHFNEMTVCDGWDLHSKNFEALKDELLPMVDLGLSALLDDLDQRGLLDETLIVCQGEFGRTPKINANAGRDHWGSCSTTFLAGGGIRGGQVYGSSDRIGAYPRDHPVDPVDIHATLYRCTGLDPHQLMYDSLHRPLPLSTGKIIEPLVQG